jgi:hypothetical protein
MFTVPAISKKYVACLLHTLLIYMIVCIVNQNPLQAFTVEIFC